MKVITKFYYRILGGHTLIGVYTAMEGKGLGKRGDLIFRNEEWEEFCKLLDSSIQIIEEST